MAKRECDKMMEAIGFTRYGGPDVVTTKVVPIPTPGPGQMLLKVKASSVNFGDTVLMRGSPSVARLGFGMFSCKVPIGGSDVAGVVEAVGEGVTGYSRGDRVFGNLSKGNKFGAWAEFAVATPEVVTHMAPEMSFAQAAALPCAGITALQGLRDHGKLREAQSVMVHGAGGGVGHFAIQIARALGASAVTAVASTPKIGLMKSLGATQVVDYKTDDFVTACRGTAFDVLLDCGARRGMADYLSVLSSGGRYVCVGGSMTRMLDCVWKQWWYGEKSTSFAFLANTNVADLDALRQLFVDGHVIPHIDKTFPLREAAAAVRYFEDTHPPGKVVLCVD